MNITDDIELIGYLDQSAYYEYAENNGLSLADFEDWKDEAEDNYYGQFNSDEDFAENLMNECGDLPDNDFIIRYIDWTKLARDLMFDYFATDSGYYFRSC